MPDLLSTDLEPRHFPGCFSFLLLKTFSYSYSIFIDIWWIHHGGNRKCGILYHISTYQHYVFVSSQIWWIDTGSIMALLKKWESQFHINSTVDGQNPALPGMVKTLYIMGESSSLVVQDFVHQQYESTDQHLTRSDPHNPPTSRPTWNKHGFGRVLCSKAGRGAGIGKKTGSCPGLNEAKGNWKEADVFFLWGLVVVSLFCWMFFVFVVFCFTDLSYFFWSFYGWQVFCISVFPFFPRLSLKRISRFSFTIPPSRASLTSTPDASRRALAPLPKLKKSGPGHQRFLVSSEST